MESSKTNKRISKIEGNIDALMDLTQNHIDLSGMSTDLNKDIVKTFSKVHRKSLDDIKSLNQKINRIINVMIFLLLYQVFAIAYPNISKWLGTISDGWSNLSEGWQILFVSLPAFFIIAIIAPIIGHLIIKKYIK